MVGVNLSNFGLPGLQDILQLRMIPIGIDDTGNRYRSVDGQDRGGG